MTSCDAHDLMFSGNEHSFLLNIRSNYVHLNFVTKKQTLPAPLSQRIKSDKCYSAVSVISQQWRKSSHHHFMFSALWHAYCWWRVWSQRRAVLGHWQGGGGTDGCCFGQRSHFGAQMVTQQWRKQRGNREKKESERQFSGKNNKHCRNAGMMKRYLLFRTKNLQLTHAQKQKCLCDG